VDGMKAGRSSGGGGARSTGGLCGMGDIIKLENSLSRNSAICTHTPKYDSVIYIAWPPVG